MRDVWIRIRKIRNADTDNKIMFEARVDLFPDAAVYEDTADEAYENMRALIPEMTEAYIETHGHVPWKQFE